MTTHLYHPIPCSLIFPSLWLEAVGVWEYLLISVRSPGDVCHRMTLGNVVAPDLTRLGREKDQNDEKNYISSFLAKL